MSETIATDVIETTTDLTSADKFVLGGVAVAGVALGVSIVLAIRKIKKLEAKTEADEIHVVTDLEDKTSNS